MRFNSLFVFTFLLAILLPRGTGETYEKPSALRLEELKEYAEQADVIFVGELTGTRRLRREGNARHWTEEKIVTFRCDEVLKGKLPYGPVGFRYLETGGTTVEARQLVEKGRMLVFLVLDPKENLYRLLHGYSKKALPNFQEYVEACRKAVGSGEEKEVPVQP